jgi:hypothetical protein
MDPRPGRPLQFSAVSRAATGQLVAVAITAVFIGFAVMRRMRPQPVRPDRLLIGGVIIVLVIGFGIVGSGGGIVSDPLALALIPVFLAAGAVLGYYLVRTMTFWADAASGALWMKGGALFALILVGTIVLRFGIRAVIFGSPFAPGSGSHGFVYDLSADLLFLSLGLWVARAYFVYQRHRAHVAA